MFCYPKLTNMWLHQKDMLWQVQIELRAFKLLEFRFLWALPDLKWWFWRLACLHMCVCVFVCVCVSVCVCVCEAVPPRHHPYVLTRLNQPSVSYISLSLFLILSFCLSRLISLMFHVLCMHGDEANVFLSLSFHFSL